MEVLLVTLVIVAVLNWIYIQGMLMLQSFDAEARLLPPRHSIIEGTNQRFLYIQDFWTMTWGDIGAVPFIWTAFMHLALQNKLNWVAMGIIGTIAIWLFRSICFRPEHKPDYGFPAPKLVSTAGFFHVLYMGAGVGAGITCLINLCMGKLTGLAMWVGIAGGVLYGITFLLDVVSGNLDSLHVVKEELPSRVKDLVEKT